MQALNPFRRIVKPMKMKAITSRTIVEYVAIRRLEHRHRGNDELPPVSPARGRAPGWL